MRYLFLPLVIVACFAATGCSLTTSTDAGISIRASDTACDISKSELIAGRQSFSIGNKGSKPTTVHVYGVGDRIIGEAGHIGPSASHTLELHLPAGLYQVACKPGLVGTGIRRSIHVTDPPE